MDGEIVSEPRARQIVLPGRGGAMAALEFGSEARPIDVVYSHANGFNARTYRTLLGPLAAEMRILAIDLRGHGASTLPADAETRHGWTDFRDDLLALLEVLDAPPVVLAGHSMGGTTSVLAAAARPERVKALALLDPVIMPSQMSTSARLPSSPLLEGALRRRATFPSKAAALEAYSGRGAFKTWRAQTLADYVEAGFRETPDGEVTLTCTPAWEASNFSMHRYDVWAAFRDSRCPIRVLRAEQGSTFRLEGHEDQIAAMGERFRIETVSGTTHFLPMEQPEAVRRLIRTTLAL